MHELDVALLSECYLAILARGMVHLRRYSIPERFDYLCWEIEHLHNLPSYIGDTNVYRHAYYFCTERPFYLNRLSTISAFETDVITSRYAEYWERLRQALMPFAEVINAKEYLERL